MSNLIPDFNNISFANPEFFWLLLLIPILWIYHLRIKQKRQSRFTSAASFFIGGYKPGAGILLPHLSPLFRSLAVFFFVVALARPQTSISREEVSTEGIDIVLAIDVSSSMLAQDFKPDRLRASIDVAKNFISGRKNDRIGLVVFSGESFTQCPLTSDHRVVKGLMEELESGMIQDGTAIGMGLATAVDRLKESEAKSKVAILMTDGVNNQGLIDPSTAAEMAATFNVRVYTIGIGKNGMAPMPVQTPYGKRFVNQEVKIDEELLQSISSETGAKYYRATDNEALKNIYDEIDQLEKTKMNVSAFTRMNEKFLPFALLALAFVVLEQLFRYTVFKPVY